jgi:hypothetical protein
VWQSTNNQFEQVLWAVQVIIEDTVKQDKQAPELQELMTAVIAQLAFIRSPAALMPALRFLKFLFTLELGNQNKLDFAEKGGFEVILKTMVKTDKTCQELILSFMAK